MWYDVFHQLRYHYVTVLVMIKLSNTFLPSDENICGKIMTNLLKVNLEIFILFLSLTLMDLKSSTNNVPFFFNGRHRISKYSATFNFGLGFLH